MLFSSYLFILAFLPAVVAGYFLINRYLPAVWGRLFLLSASLAFMGLWNVHFILVLLVSVAVNLLFGSFLSRAVAKRSPIGKPVFIAAIAANILYLGFFK